MKSLKAILLFGAAGLLVALGAALAFRAFREIEEPAEDRKRAFILIDRADDFLSALKDAETGERGYALTGDEAFLEPYLAVRDRVGRQLNELRRLTSHPEAHRHLDAVAPLMDAKMAELAHVIALRRSGDMAGVLEVVGGGEGKRLMDSIRSEMRGFLSIEEALLTRHDEEFQAKLRRLFSAIVAASVAALLFALAFAFLIRRDTHHRLKSLVHLETRHLLEKEVDANRRLHDSNLALQISEEKLAVTLYSIGDGVIATDAEGRVTLLNPLAERLTGWTQAEATGLPVDDIFQIVNQESRRPLPVPVKDALTHGTVQGLANHAVLVARDGSERSVADSCAPIRDRDGLVVGAVLVFRDVTEEYAAEQALRDSTARIQAILNTAQDGIVTVRAGDGIIEDANPAAERMFGYAAGGLAGLSLGLLIPGTDVSEPARPEGPGRDVSGRRKDGGEIPLEMAISEMRMGGQRYITGILRDVTARRQAKEALLEAGALLRQKNAELESASQMKSEFLASMSHELRTPLNAIIGFSEVLRDGLMGELTEQQQRFVGDIFSSGTHLLSLINDILDLSKVEAGKMALDLESFDVPALLANGLSIVGESAATRHVQLRLETTGELGSIFADARKVKQIVYNLLSNAVKFAKEGGQVTLRAGPVQRADVGRPTGPKPRRSFPLADSAFAEFLEISVADDGIGIPRDGLERLFLPFSQIDSGLARRFEGTGLGLAMVKLLAELHGGTVTVESVEGQGACFTVWLPLRRRAIRKELAPRHGAEASAGSLVALVVEADPRSAALIRVQLEAEGFSVLHAASAEAALVLVNQQPLSLITLDVLLPDGDGWEFLGRLKRMPDARRIPVLIISILADRNKGFALGAAAVMQKPISRQELYESLVDIGLFPLPPSGTLKVLVVDDDPKAVELAAVRLKGLASTILKAYGGRDAIDTALRELPDLIVLDLMMPEVSGFDVVEALKGNSETTKIPIVVVTAKQITADDRAQLNGYVTTIMEKNDFDRFHFADEVRRAMSLRPAPVEDQLPAAAAAAEPVPVAREMLVPGAS